MLVFEFGSTFDRVLLVDMLEDAFDLLLVVAQFVESKMHRLIDDLEHPTTGKLLVFDQGDVWLDAGSVTVHHETDRSRRR